MKTILSKSYITIYFLLVSFITFAFPGDNSDTGDLSGTDPAPQAPIDDYIIPVAIFAILCAFMYFRSLKMKQNKRQNRMY